jgi:hypothetical protein
MSQSQHSDFQSSIYNGDLDNLSYLTPSIQAAIPSGSQAISESHHEFLPPDLPLPQNPPSFTCVGPDRRKNYFLYDMSNHTEWVDWWLQTDYGSKSKIHWDSGRHSEIWSSFHQVAQITDGAPSVMCKRCGRVLKHPYSVRPGSDKGYQGTSTMAKHLKTTDCQRAAAGRRDTEITGFLKKGVSS